MLANAAAAAGIDSIDAPFADTNDPEGLFLDTQNARTFGFKGKFAINPRQISVIHKGICADRERNRLGQAHSCRH